MTDNTEEYVITWEAPVIEKPEFRLYHDEDGRVITYTCEKLEGTYIVIDAMAFAEARPDVIVIDGKAIRMNSTVAISSRLYKSNAGTLCEAEDVSIITISDGQYWKIKTRSI